MKFRKMHGLGNDFVIFDARKDNIFLTADNMALIADRHWGVGCDLITILDESENADIFAYFFNADGSESGACGNATRCVADIIMSETGKNECSIEVTYGILNCKKKGEFLVEVDMGAARDVKDLDLTIGDALLNSPSPPLPNPPPQGGRGVYVNMGNPHLVFFVDKLEDISVEELGAYFETHENFPDRTNVEFVQVVDKTKLIQKTWERGVGITQACGSGACAVMVAAHWRALVDNKAEIELDGGTLQMELTQDNHILMTGAVAYVFEGKLHEQ